MGAGLEDRRCAAGRLEAARDGDLSGLTELLSGDVAVWNDGGGKVRAALHPVTGRDHVIAFVTALGTRYLMGEARLVDANGQPALLTTIDGGEQLVALDVRDGRTHGICAVLNPDKLTHVQI
ncbi:hypothetical protein [Streptomyces sp. NPDC005181]|uniref:hypothetical protein n=1 Tax=Streptomyces sp. NPDC005181 TaxID=3156869 RepID=UPI00339F7B99